MFIGLKLMTVLDKPLPTFELVAIRMGITWVCSRVYMFWANIPSPNLGPKGVRKWLMIRGFVGFFGVFGLYYAIQHMPLSDATVLTFLAPTMTSLIGFIFSKETLSLKQVLAGLTSLCGVMLIARPAFLFRNGGVRAHILDTTGTQRMVAVCVALVGVLATSIAYTSIQMIGKRAHPMHAISYYSLCCVIMGSAGMIITGAEWVLPNQWTFILALLFIGLFGFLSQIFLTVGLQHETASRGTLAMYIQIVFTVTFEYLAFGTVPSRLSVAGAVIIIASAIYVVLSKTKLAVLPIGDIEEANGIWGGQVPVCRGDIESGDDGSSVQRAV